jgi:hypothetical protein
MFAKFAQEFPPSFARLGFYRVVFDRVVFADFEKETP